MIRIFSICLLSVALFLTGCKNLKDLQFSGVKGFKIGKIGTEGMDADILLGIKNPNNHSFNIYKSEFDVSYSGIYLGKAKLKKKVRIKANAEETYSFHLTSDFKNINMADVMALLSGASRRGMVEIKGDLKAGKFYYKYKFPVNVKERVGMD